jgi:hypothetical protein
MEEVVENERPRLDSFRKLFADAWRLCKKHYVVLLSIIAVPQVSSLVAQLFYLQKTPFSYIGIPFFIFSLAFSIVGSIAAIFALAEGLGIKDSYNKAIALFWPLVWMGLLSLVLSLGGFIMFIVPAMLMSIWFYFTVFIFVVEKKRGLNVFVQSREYVRGYWWSIFGRTFLLCLCAYIPIFILAFTMLKLFGMVGWIGTIYVLGSLMYPFFISYSYAIYRNMKILKPDLAATQSTSDIGFFKVAAIVGLAGILGIAILIAFVSAFIGGRTFRPSADSTTASSYALDASTTDATIIAYANHVRYSCEVAEQDLKKQASQDPNAHYVTGGSFSKCFQATVLNDEMATGTLGEFAQQFEWSYYREQARSLSDTDLKSELVTNFNYLVKAYDLDEILGTSAYYNEYESRNLKDVQISTLIRSMAQKYTSCWGVPINHCGEYGSTPPPTPTDAEINDQLDQVSASLHDLQNFLNTHQ